MGKKSIRYEVLERIPRDDVQALAAIILRDLRCWQRPTFGAVAKLIQDALGETLTMRYEDLKGYQNIAKKFNAQKLSSMDREWSELYWPHGTERGSVKVPQGLHPNPEAWRRLTRNDLRMLWYISTGAEFICEHGPRMVVLCRALDEVAGGRAENYRGLFPGLQ